MISQHWFGYWLGAVRQQAIIYTWGNVDPDLCRQMGALGLNELTHHGNYSSHYDNFFLSHLIKTKIAHHNFVGSQDEIFFKTAFYLIIMTFIPWGLLYFLNLFLSRKKISWWDKQSSWPDKISSWWDKVTRKRKKRHEKIKSCVDKIDFYFVNY